MESIFTILGISGIFILMSISSVYAEEIIHIIVGPEKVSCVGVAKQDCLLVKTSPDADWTMFYQPIDGFDFVSGYEYELSVQVTEIKNPPADASSKKYTLVEIVEKKSTSTRHIPYNGVCAPGFVSLGEICVLNDRCGPGAYPGKICEMDGKVQPYLRPLQQGEAGIAAGNVICAEGLELMFKSHNSAPSCVKPSSVDELQNRSWQKSVPLLACTLEYAPICGVDGQTYGNKCMLNTQHVAMKHQGECKAITEPTEGILEKTLEYTKTAPVIDDAKGYFVTEIAPNVYWLVSSGYQTMFLVTDEGVVTVDAPQPIGEKYIDAINEVTQMPITHMIYSHHHQDHTGAAGQLFSENIIFISHKETADVLAEQNDPNRPVPTLTFEGNLETLNIGNQVIELHHLGNFHSNGDLLILLPEQNVAMLVDLLRPAASPYRAFGMTPDIDLYLQTHDVLQDFDFDVLVSGHTGILATKDHIKANKEFTLDVMKNAKDALEQKVSNPTEYCVKTTTQNWQDKLAGLETFMTDHCNAMIDYHSLEN